MSLSIGNELNQVQSFMYQAEEFSIRFSPRFLTFRPKYDINVQTKKYSLTTAKSMDQLIQVFALRQTCFLGTGENDQYFDVDEFDHICDHLIITCNETGHVVGTYRILSSETTDTFYSETEFDLSQVKNLSGTKIELGRACIDPYYRNGYVIDLLWRGIAKYIQKTNAKYVFGCSSVKTMSPHIAFALCSYLNDKNYSADEYGIAPIGKYKMHYDQDSLMHIEDIESYIPTLLKSYLKAGARVISEPALDAEFKCIDFFTVIDVKNLSENFKRRYMRP